MYRRLLLVFALPALLGATAGAPDRPPIERSVLRIVTYSQRGDWSKPWDMTPVRQGSGSGFVIRGGLVMTNAHVVSDARMILFFLHGDPDPHQAQVALIGHDCDLALLRPAEAGLLDRVTALDFGGLPGLGSTVDTFGYPAAGTQISSTRGVVSRVDTQVYTHSGADRHLVVQTDAAINPGNSGGPVIQDGKVVGVAFEAAGKLQNVGFFIPTEVIGRFLTDVADGRYDGYPELGVMTSGMENPAARRKAALRDGESGVRVNLVYPGSSASGFLEAGDVLLQVDGKPVADDGSVDDGGLRIPFGMLVDRRQIGEKVTLRILRAGVRSEVVVPLSGYAPVATHRNRYDRLPRYYIYGGLVFVPLDLETMKTAGADWYAAADRVELYEYALRPLAEPDLLRQERVLLLGRLDHPVNANMAWFENQVVEQVNGRKIGCLEDLVEAIESHRGDYHVFEFADYRRFGVLERAAADRANAEILERYGISKDRNL